MWVQLGIGYTNVGWIEFTQSLDACFKWLVPKLFAIDIHTIWTSTETVYEAYMVVVHKDSDNDYRATELTPALALCLAIERLIDGNDN